MRCQPCRKQRRLIWLPIKVVACGHDVSVYPEHGQNHPPIPHREIRRQEIQSSLRAKESGKGQSRNGAKKSARPAASRPATSKPKSSKIKPWTAAEVHEAFSRFSKANPEPKGELEHLNPYTLLVAVVLSAQATDAGVNKATRALFAVADTPEKMLALGEEKRARLHQDHRALSQQGEERHRAVGNADRANTAARCRATATSSRRCPASGARPPTSCSTSPSASRPWRSIRMSSASPTAPDWRPARRRSRSSRGWRRSIPAEFMLHAHHWLILHGRYTCLARKPRCEVCLINDLCRWPEKTV